MAAAMGLFISLYNANVSTDWPRVASAGLKIPIRAVLPVQNVVPPDPSWPPSYPPPFDYAAGVRALQASHVDVFAYLHLRNVSRPCCSCCGNLTQCVR